MEACLHKAEIVQVASHALLAQQPESASEKKYATVLAKFGKGDAGIRAATTEATMANSREPHRDGAMSTTRKLWRTW